MAAGPFGSAAREVTVNGLRHHDLLCLVRGSDKACEAVHPISIWKSGLHLLDGCNPPGRWPGGSDRTRESSVWRPDSFVTVELTPVVRPGNHLRSEGRVYGTVRPYLVSLCACDCGKFGCRKKLSELETASGSSSWFSASSSSAPCPQGNAM